MQHGAALLVMLVILVLGMATLLVGSLNSSALQIARNQSASYDMAHARDALIGDAVSQIPVASAGFMRLPDLGFKVGLAPAEGSAAPNFSGNNKNYSVAGKLPWKTLGLEPLRDSHGECLWYVVSGHFKKFPVTDALNWDTPGQINLVDGNGNIIASNLAALVATPGPVLDGQNRGLSDPAYAQCGGNYDARNYLDPYTASDAVSGTVNYFIGSTNNRVALDTADKLILIAGNEHYNDRFLFITTDDIFRAVMRRSDFSVQITALLSDVYFQSVAIAGSKGTDNVNCNFLGSDNQAFCKNWKEMLLLTQLTAPSPVTIDGAPSADCARVLFFGGQKNAVQLRLTPADKANPANYIDGVNQLAFATPVAASNSFIGASVFSANDPGADLLKCLP